MIVLKELELRGVLKHSLLLYCPFRSLWLNRVHLSVETVEFETDSLVPDKANDELL